MIWKILAVALITPAIISDYLDSITAAAVWNRVTGLPIATHVASGACNPSGVIAGAIRNDGKGWRVIHDADHAPINITSVETTKRTIRVNFAIEGTTIRSFIATPDETLARSGFTIGASVGLRSADLMIGRPGIFGARHVSPALVDLNDYPWSNIWIYGLIEGEC
jgi:hypothetical protein